MKTILTLIAFSFFSFVTQAAEKRPELKVTSTGEYLIIVDGKQYHNDKTILISDMKQGIHYIDVFKKKKGLFGSKYKLVSSKQFEIGKKDLNIEVNASGYIMIGKQGKGWDGDYWLNKDKNNKNR